MDRSVNCWCYAVGRMVSVRGTVIRRLAVDVLEVSGCRQVGCGKCGKSECLVGKQLQGRW